MCRQEHTGSIHPHRPGAGSGSTGLGSTPRPGHAWAGHALLGCLWCIVLTLLPLRPVADARQNDEGRRPEKVLETERLVLVGPDGKKQVVLGTNTLGQPELEFLDPAGKSQLSMGLDPKGHPRIRLRDDRSNRHLLLFLDSRGSPSVSLTDANGKLRLSLSLDPDDAPHLMLADAADEAQATLAVQAEGFPALSLQRRPESPSGSPRRIRPLLY